MMFLFIFIIILSLRLFYCSSIYILCLEEIQARNKKSCIKALTIMPMANFLIKHKKRWIWAEYPEFSQ